MKSGKILTFHEHPKYVNLFTELDLVAIKEAQENLDALYEKEDKLYFNEDIEGYNLTKNCSFSKPTIVDNVVQMFITPKTIDTPLAAEAAAEVAEVAKAAEAATEATLTHSIYKSIKNYCSVQ
jgi:hypothetical protein